MIKTELELRFIFDVTRPMSERERTILMDALSKIKQLRHRNNGGNMLATGDIQELEAHVGAFPTEEQLAEAAKTDLLIRVDKTEEHRRILEALQRSDGNITSAAKMLGMPRRTLFNRLKKLNIKFRRKMVQE